MVTLRDSKMTHKTFIPYTEGKYYLDQDNNLFNYDGTKISILKEGDDLLVELDWVNGLDKYKLITVILITQFDIKIPFELWNQIEPLYKNKDILDLSTDNLTYTFKDKPLEVPNKPNFYYIPFYTHYCIDKDGNLYSFLKRFIKKWGVSKPNSYKNIKGGYYTGRVKKDFGGVSHCGRHRLLLLAFFDYNEQIDSLVSNHINGVPGDDRLENLELVTRAENNQHAIDAGLTNRLVPIRVKNTLTGYESVFPSIRECTRYLNVCYGFIYNRLSKQKLYDDGWLFKVEDGSDWPILENKIYKSTVFQDVVCRNIFTGSIHIFSSAKEASRYTNCCSATILNHCKQKQMMPVDGFNFRFTNDAYSWPNYSKEHLELFASKPRCINKKVLIEVIERTLKVPLSSN